MQSRAWIALAVGIVVATGPSVRAQQCEGAGTEVGGLIDEDTTWDKAGSPYIVVNSIIVGDDDGDGATLTIEEGVCVRFKSGLGLTVGHTVFGSGTLVGRGTEKSPILFTSNQPYEGEPKDPAPGDWSRIYFTDYAIDSEYDEFGEYLSGCVLEHVIVEYSGSGGDAPPAITAEGSSPYLAHCEVHDNQGKGIHVTSTGAGDVKIQDCVVHHNEGTNGSAIGVNATGGGAVAIERCQVHDHANIRGIAVTAGAFLVTIEYCEIARCSTNWHGGGIYVNAGAGHIVSHNIVEDCSATASGSVYGGGIYVNASATLEGNTVTDNSLTIPGGWYNSACGAGIYVNGVVTLNDNTVTGNTLNANSGYCTGYGGGIFLDSFSDGSTLSDNVVTGNTANSYNVAYGGGICLWSSGTCTLTSNTVTGNSVDGFGGGISLRNSGDSTLGENIITDNWTTGQWGHGGGIYLEESGGCLIQDNHVTGNSTSGQNAGGGGIRLQSCWNCSLMRNTVTDNVTTGSLADGGGILVVGGGIATLDSNIITNNTSGDEGGGILFWASGRWALESNVITDNTAATNAGGIYFGQSGCADYDPDPQCTMKNNVIARNHTNGDTGGIYVLDSTWLSFAGDPETGTSNLICGNDGFCISNKNTYNANGSNDIDARWVRWGACDTAEIQDCIYDFFDNAGKGFVLWDPLAGCEIVSTFPPNCAIDARQPGDVNDCDAVFGWSQIELTFVGELDPPPAAEDFTVTQVGGDGVPPAICDVIQLGADTVEVILCDAIEPGAWTCITHNESISTRCMGYLPADVNGDGTSGPVDILDLIDFLNGVGPDLEIWQCDCDRSEECNPADILCVIDLLNGAGCYDPWNGETLPECPSALCPSGAP